MGLNHLLNLISKTKKKLLSIKKGKLRKSLNSPQFQRLNDEFLKNDSQ